MKEKDLALPHLYTRTWRLKSNFFWIIQTNYSWKVILLIDLQPRKNKWLVKDYFSEKSPAVEKYQTCWFILSRKGITNCLNIFTWSILHVCHILWGNMNTGFLDFHYLIFSILLKFLESLYIWIANFIEWLFVNEMFLYFDDCTFVDVTDMRMFCIVDSMLQKLLHWSIFTFKVELMYESHYTFYAKMNYLGLLLINKKQIFRIVIF